MASRPSVATIAIGGPLYGEDEVFLGFKGIFTNLKTHIRQLTSEREVYWLTTPRSEIIVVMYR